MNEWVVEFGQSDELVARIYAGGDDAVKAIRDYATECKAYCRSLVAVAKSVQPRWIPVDERLPEEGEQVIVWMPDCPHHPCGMDMGSCMTDSWGVSWMVSGGRSAFPTHWMPLLEPPAS